MKIPLVIWVAVWVQLVPLTAAFARPALLTGPRRGVAIWLVLLFLTDGISYAWSHWWGLGNNHVVSFVLVPVQGVAILWAIAGWQVRPLLRQTVRLCIPLLLLWWGVDIAYLEDISSFSVIGSPVYNILVLGAVLLAILTRARAAEESLLRQDWFWMLSGLMIFFATNAIVTIVQGAAIESGDLELAVRAGSLKAAIDIISYLLLTGGFLWAHRRTSSGDSLSPGPSRSSSSSSRSWSPS